MSDKRWYAVYTRVQWEKKVSNLLSQRNIENYCPLNKVNRQWNNRTKIVYEPLFVSYVFVNTTEAEHLELKKTSGIINLVHWLGKPAAIPEQEIEIIRKFISEHENISLEKANVNIHGKVRIINGSVKHQEGNVIAINSQTIKIMLPSLGFIMSAEVGITKNRITSSKIRKSIDQNLIRLRTHLMGN